jgi:hypothetical protein
MNLNVSRDRGVALAWTEAEASGQMRRRMAILMAFVALQACATHVVSSNERSVIVDSYWMDVAKAQELADAECAKHSRIATMTIKADPWERHYVFYCIDR